MEQSNYHPIVQRARAWWPTVPLGALSIWGIGGESGRALAMHLVGMAGVAAAAGLGTVGLHGLLVGASREVLHMLKGHHFVCPHCLRFGGRQWACGSCGRELTRWHVATNGCYAPACPACGVTLFGAEPARPVEALCSRCGGRCDTDPFHQRGVRVELVPLPADFEAATRLPGAVRGSHGTAQWAIVDRGDTLVALLHLTGDQAPASAPGFALSSAQALRVGLAPANAGSDALLAFSSSLDRWFRLRWPTQVGLSTLPVHLDQPLPDGQHRHLMATCHGRCRVVAPDEAQTIRSEAA